jgi:hypothetical protein
MTALAQKSMTAEELAACAWPRTKKHWELFDAAPEVQPPQNIGHSQAVWNAMTASKMRLRRSEPAIRGFEALLQGRAGHHRARRRSAAEACARLATCAIATNCFFRLSVDQRLVCIMVWRYGYEEFHFVEFVRKRDEARAQLRDR